MIRKNETHFTIVMILLAILLGILLFFGIKHQINNSKECKQLCGEDSIVYSCSEDLAVCVDKDDLKYYPKQ